jgi:predicted TIM-barrel fold metal-dependent hydrolase
MTAVPGGLFDAHLHIIDPRFPLETNQGYRPDPFTVADYRRRTADLGIVGGAVVSGSFQAFDTTYLTAALEALGPTFVGVVQLSATVTEEEVARLDHAGVRAARINVRRGGADVLAQLQDVAALVHAVAGWHVELYIDSRDLAELAPTLRRLPAAVVDHLGLSEDGFDDLLSLVGDGLHVKATGFGRLDLDVPAALRALHAANPRALMVGTDLPSTRAPRPFRDSDLRLVADALGEDAAAAFRDNAERLYRPAATQEAVPSGSTHPAS